MSERKGRDDGAKDKANKGLDTPNRTVFNADGTIATPPGGDAPGPWTQRQWQDRDKDAGFYREGDDEAVDVTVAAPPEEEAEGGGLEETPVPPA